MTRRYPLTDKAGAWSVDCAHGRHHLCRVDRDPCDCPHHVSDAATSSSAVHDLGEEVGHGTVDGGVGVAGTGDEDAAAPRVADRPPGDPST